ncbi:hypothetical protein Y032_0001g330 [Ancylostoma ceylanicum]|uniref:Uncharacterized protein n=1 Tax=Ancylostoma ceylanicum TaxID=53326 RepID=A0A016W325_9BILA|nr:hypothetical protein Y032_0001g330 [Ancylostoma ceylanicum]
MRVLAASQRLRGILIQAGHAALTCLCGKSAAHGCVQTLEAKLNETVTAYEAKTNECGMNQIALNEAEKRLTAAEEKASTAEARLGEIENKAQHERSVSSLVRLLVNALNNNPTLNENDHWLAMLYDLLRERNGAPDTVPEPPVIKMPKIETLASDVVGCKKCEYLKDLNDREALIRAEMESYLKDNLQLQGEFTNPLGSSLSLECSSMDIRLSENVVLTRVRDLESELAIAVSPMCVTGKDRLELDDPHSLGTSPAAKKSNSHVPVPTTTSRQSNALDPLHDTVFIISLAPFLALILLLLAPFHVRFMQYVKQD